MFTFNDRIISRRESLISLGRRRNKSDGTRDPIVMTRSLLLVDSVRNNNIPEEEEEVEKEEASEFTDLLKSMLNPKVLADPKFLLIGVSNFFGFLGFYVPFVYLPSMAEDKEGISGDEAAYLLSIIGISNTLGRVVTGWVSDMPCVSSILVVNMSLILSSISLFAMPSLQVRKETSSCSSMEF